MTYIFIDLEATCCNQGSIPRSEMEIIEIGAVSINEADFSIISEFDEFVRPIRHPVLTEFCKKLTSIRQTDVGGADGFKAVADRLKNWFWSFSSPVFCSWGDYDLKQMIKDCRFHSIPFPLSQVHVNIKNEFSASLGLKKPCSFGRALKLSGLDFWGTPHRAIDDVRNMARICPYIFGQKKPG